MNRNLILWILCLLLLYSGTSLMAQSTVDPFADTSTDIEDDVLRRRSRDKIFYEDGVIYERTEAKGHSIVAYHNIRLY
ncbi:MAG: hypothetical protein AAGM67_17015, partial [Bacteroidota bacterium]